MIGKHDKVQLDLDSIINSSGNHGRHKGIAPKPEEIVIPVDVRKPEDFAPDAGKQRLGFRIRPLTRLDPGMLFPEQASIELTG
jgi:hypothetical protein